MILDLFVSISLYHTFFCLSNLGRRQRHLLPVKINEIISEHPDNANYGYDRIHKALEIRGIKVSRNTVYRAMKDGNLIHKARKPRGITKASTEIQDKENLIKRDFTADKPVKNY